MLKIKSFIFVTLALLLIVGAMGCSAVQSVMPGGSGTFASVDPTHKDLAYAEVSDAQKLDLYIPTSGTGPFPS